MSAQGPVNPVPTGASIAFAEGFRPQSEALQGARKDAIALGVQPLSAGSVSMLTVLAKLIGAQAVVEIGTGAGVSGLALFDGMAASGILTSVDAEHEVQAAARRAFTGAQIPTRRFRLIAGQALDVLPKLSDGAYDLVLINGDHLEYGEYVAQALRLLRHGGVMVINHALWANKIADPDNQEDETIVIREALSAVQDIEDFVATLSPIGDGLLIAVKG
ncbi:MAG: class I SAM-dependent methyltransferase [Propionibacteriaceae bacterium]|nr:class I SAM-dependent methyltransferase [Propionibacteriaceae bacterium]